MISFIVPVVITVIPTAECRFCVIAMFVIVHKNPLKYYMLSILYHHITFLFGISVAYTKEMRSI